MSVSISKTLSSKIKAVSFLCTVLIVLLHAYEQSLVSESNHCSIYVAKFLSLGVCEMATPFFFIISGFLLACQYDNGMPYSQLLKRRLSSLGKPYVYWCILYALIYVVFNVLCNHLAGRALNENTCLVMPLYSWENPFRVLNPFRILGFDLFEFPVNGPLWYVRNLFFLVLLSSVLMAVMKTKARGQIFIALVFVLYMVHFTIPSPWHKFFQTGFSFRGLLFFSIGIYLERFPMAWKPEVLVPWLLCFVWLLLALPWQLSPNLEFIVLRVSIVIGCIALWSIYDIIPWREKLESWHGIQYSFFIYASHFAILNILFCKKACDLIRLHIMNSDLLIYVVRFVVPLTMSMAMAAILDRYMPKIYRALTGGR